ncbi:pentatricopeptide repeat-containing protein At1g02370, mitochondrial-like isoform X2 [Tripterygium wilfordii]|nr:pentatricopeptide repeat-containing protein At1g02370, mitochondrial-like isoform X2 [Tripterygium wilfordii]
MEWMERRKMNFSLTDYAILVDLVSKVKGISAAENFFNCLSPSKKNKFTYGALLNCYCEKRLKDQALAHFEKMGELKFVTNSLPFNNLMKLYMQLGQPEKVPTLVYEMKQRNITPCSFAYNLWMQSYASLNDIDGVERVMEEMKVTGEDTRNWTTYSNLAAIYVRAGLFDRAESALKTVEEKATLRDREAYHFLISLYAKISLTEVKRMWSSLKSKFSTVTNSSYLVMLQALAKLDVQSMKELFEEWESGCSAFDFRLPSVAIKAYLGQGMREEATRVFDNAIKRTYNPLFKARETFMVFYVKNHQPDLALQHLKAALFEVKEKNWHPAPETVGAFFEYFEKRRDVDGAEEFCKNLRNLNHLDSFAYLMLLKTYVAANKQASEMRRRLEEDNIVMSKEIENLLEKVCPK